MVSDSSARMWNTSIWLRVHSASIATLDAVSLDLLSLDVVTLDVVSLDVVSQNLVNYECVAGGWENGF